MFLPTAPGRPCSFRGLASTLLRLLASATFCLSMTTGIVRADTRDLDAPFDVPRYLIHHTGRGTSGGYQPLDYYSLEAQLPQDGTMLTPDGMGGTFTDNVETTGGPFSTLRQVCSFAQDGGLPAVSSAFGCPQEAVPPPPPPPNPPLQNEEPSVFDRLAEGWNGLSQGAKLIWSAFIAFIVYRVFKTLKAMARQASVRKVMDTGKPFSTKVTVNKRDEDGDLVRDKGGNPVRVTIDLTGGNNKIPTVKVLPNAFLSFEVQHNICTDGIGPPANKEGTHLSETAMGSINADTSRYIVLPGKWYQQFGIDKGDVAIVACNGVLTGAVFAEVGPEHKLGESSTALHEKLGQLQRAANGLAVNDPTKQPVQVIVIPGSRFLFPRGKPSSVPENVPVGKTNFPTNDEIDSIALSFAKQLKLLP